MILAIVDLIIIALLLSIYIIGADSVKKLIFSMIFFAFVFVVILVLALLL